MNRTEVVSLLPLVASETKTLTYIHACLRDFDPPVFLSYSATRVWFIYLVIYLFMYSFNFLMTHLITLNLQYVLYSLLLPKEVCYVGSSSLWRMAGICNRVCSCHIHIYIYIYKEKERERERKRWGEKEKTREREGERERESRKYMNIYDYNNWLPPVSYCVFKLARFKNETLDK